MLAVCHAGDHAIAAKLSDELNVPYDDAVAWVELYAADLERWRHVGEADLCERLQAIADGKAEPINGTELSLLTEMARQRLGWSRESVPEKVHKSVQAAKKAAAKSGPRGLKAVG